jgi:hypothetical protein
LLLGIANAFHRKFGVKLSLSFWLMYNRGCVAGGSSFANLQQRVAKIGSPPLLDENWRTQGTRKQLRTTEIGPSFFFMMFISFAVKIHRSTITTVA